LRRFVRGHSAALIYSNTITNGHALAALSEMRVPVITHVRELEGMIQECREDGSLAHTLRLTDRYIAVSQAVKDDLIHHCGIADDRIDVVRNFLPDLARYDMSADASRRRIREMLGLPPDCLMVVGCGTTRPIKGPDFFVAAAANVKRRVDGHDVCFVWVGGEASGPQFETLMNEAVRRGVAQRVRFLGHRADYLEFIAAADVFVLPSREDPAPLVVLEAGFMGVPTVCFLGAGGAPEFVRDDAGICVANGDANAMAAAISKLLESAQLRAALGSCARDRARRDHVVSVGASEVEAIISKVVTDSQTRLAH
ncbi:MAG TPA: glycosyltransferase family 4 protein, partial [Rudaea sp.]